MTIQRMRGTHDILPGAVELWQRIEETARRVFALYGFREVRTPLFEETELFARSIGSDTDIVRKQMYTWQDGQGHSFTLRPEGTAPVVRACLEHRLLGEGLLHKLYYVGPMFRRERPQKGRYRQFHQIGAEVLGSDHPAIEAEAIEMLERFFRELGMPEFRLLINSVGCPLCRPAYVEELRQALGRGSAQLCADCRRRSETNPLRTLDCKKEGCQKVLEGLPTLLDRLCEPCRDHFARFQKHLELYGIGYQVSPRLVRGLDYYVRTTFEITSERLGPTQNALVGGGRYDGLTELLGGPASQGFGFALGMERLVLVLAPSDNSSGGCLATAPEIFLVYLDEASFEQALELARQLRQQDLFAYVDFAGRSLKAQMRLADRLGARFTCVIGAREVREGSFPVKRMADGLEARLPRQGIAPYLKEQIRK